jgi:hypothetical protein
MKSQEHVLLQVEKGLLMDVLSAYPQMRGVDKDLVRITSLVENRGLGVFTLDLPNLDSLLLQGLEKGRLPLEGPCCKAVSKRVRVPRLFSGLWLRVFDKSGVLREDVDPTSIAFLRQLCCLGKRLEVGCSPARRRAAMEDYHGIESKCRKPTLGWERDVLDPDNRGHTVHFHDGVVSDLPLFPEQSGDSGNLRRLLGNLEHVCSKVSAAFGTPDVYSLSVREGIDVGTVCGLRHGPGAVSDGRKGDDKYSFPNWPEKLQHHFPFDAFGVLNHSHLEDRAYPSSHEPPSELSGVPKTAKAPRLIASEPTAHQWCQQILAEYIVSTLSRVFKGDFVTIKDQEPSRRMVVAASLDRSLSTIDLSSASDRLSCWAVERVFRGNKIFLELLHAVRTRWTVDQVTPGERNFLKLRKFATQGSALTFPIQSVVFLCCCLAVLPRERSLEAYRLRWRESVRVFGDDIIIPTDRYADLRDLLHFLGLKVNENKSFSEGFFRESCGQDSYKGFDVTPSRPRSLRSDTPTGWSAVVDYTNNLFLKGYWHACKALESTLPGRVRKDLPIVGLQCGIQGRISFCGGDISHLKRRKNVFLHRDEVRVRAIIDRPRRKSASGYSALFRFLNQRLGSYERINFLSKPPRPRLGSEYALESNTREGFRWVPCEELSVIVPPLSRDNRRDRTRYFT